MKTEDELYERIYNLELSKYALEDENEMLKEEIKHLKEEIEHIIQDREDNFRRISISQQVGVYDKDLI